ncbi:MAG: CoA transferase subunit A [Chloroflexota bacterium]|nr:CoA transferase subunit A [Chloroflexota bacterium]MDP9471996.1 CoA transferase subunit A [Chloroflexota bacterium]
MRTKLTSLVEAISTVKDRDIVALGGNLLHRGPCAAVHELVRQGRRWLEIVKTAGAYDVDLLCATGVAGAVSAGFVGFETPFGMAPGYRRAVESGTVEAKEHACYTVIAGLRAVIQGVPFMPVAGMLGSDVLAARGFKTIADPYTGAEVVAAPALIPDVAFIHVQEADAEGNGRIVGTRFEDVLMAQAARRVVITAERIVDGETFEAAPETVAIPGFMVDAVVEAPRGAWPCSCAGLYGYDEEYLAAYITASRDPADLARFVETHVLMPEPSEVSA